MIGAGTMGGGIAMSFASAGIPVILVETKQEALDRGLATIRKNYAGTVAKGKLVQEEADRRIARIQADPGLRRSGGGRSRDRGGVRGHGREEGAVRQARRAVQARRRARHQHLPARRERDRRQHVPARFGDRPALLQPGQRDAPRGSRARPGHVAAGHRHVDDRGAQDRQAAGAGGRVRRLRRQPHGGAVRARSRVPAGGRRDAGAGGRCAEEVRPGHGALRDVRPGRPRHQLVQPQAPGGDTARAPALLEGGGPPLRTGPLRAEDRRRLLQVRSGQPHAGARSRS